MYFISMPDDGGLNGAEGERWTERSRLRRRDITATVLILTSRKPPILFLPSAVGATCSGVFSRISIPQNIQRR